MAKKQKKASSVSFESWTKKEKETVNQKQKKELNIPQIVALLGGGVILVAIILDIVATITTLLGAGTIAMAWLLKKKNFGNKR